MIPEKLVEALEESNKWWKEELKLEFRPREIYGEIKKFFPTKQIIALTGLRRTGKTTLLLKLIKESFPKLDKKNIVYFSFDEFRSIELREIIKTYSRLMNKSLSGEKYLFLFDEIQKVENWDEQLKRLYDNYPNIKFIISGSESLFIRKKSRESLAGRIYEFQVKTLSFKEYLSFKNKKFENLSLYKEEILREFNSFLISNGFPEMVNENPEIIEKYIKENVIQKIIYQDIPRIFPIKNPGLLEQIFLIILNDPGEIINIDELGNELGATRQTVSLYLDYLEKSFLLKKLYNFSNNARKSQRKMKKYYPTILIPNLVKKTEKFGRVFETVLVNQLNADFFWRDSAQNEVDVVLLVEQEIIPLEIKTSKIEFRPLKLFMKKFKLEKGLILTYDKKEHLTFESKTIEVVPFYEYLLRG